MPRYFLNIRDADQLFENPDGSEWPDLRAAKAEAVAAGCEIAAERLRAGKAPGARHFEIRDDAGRMLARVPFPDIANAP